jgi:hypothetical protein
LEKSDLWKRKTREIKGRNRDQKPNNDSRSAELHLLICNAEMICEPMITEGNKRKRQSQMTLPFSLVIFCADLLL